MFTKIAAASSLVAFAGVVLAQEDLGIDSPSQLRTCIPVQLNWHGGEAPYYLQILEGGSTSDQIESLLDGTDDTSYTWTVDLDAGTEVTLGITDSSGDSAYSSVLTITEGGSGCSSSGSGEESGSASEGDSSSTAAAAGGGESSAAASNSGAESSAAQSGSSAAASESGASSAQSSSAAESSSSPSSSSSSSSENASETESTAPEDNDDSSAVTLKHAGMASVAGALAFVALA